MPKQRFGLAARDPICSRRMPSSSGSRFDVDEDPKHQHAEWRFEQVGWVIWAAVVLIAATGLLGNGPLSSALAASPDGSVQIEYPRFNRLQAESELKVRLGNRLLRGGVVHLKVSRAFDDTAAIERIQPEPRETVNAGRYAIYLFPVSPSAATADFTFRFKSSRAGIHMYAFGIEDGPEVQVRTVVLP